MEAPGFFLFISTTITLITAAAITLYVRYSVNRAVHSKMEEELLRAEKLQMEEKLIVARQMATIGALAGGMAFHLDSTLRGLKELIKILRSTARNNPSVANLSQTISQQLSDAIAVSYRVCQATYPDRLKLRRVSATEIVTDVIKSLNTTSAGVEIETTTACQDDVIFANVQLVRQVLENVLINAFNALADRSGKVQVLFSNRAPEEILEDISGMANIPQLQITVTDNGVGMAPEALENVFIPHFGKETGAHTGAGLGLSLCYAIMQMLQGEIAISSRLGEGTSVSLNFPLALGRDETQSLGMDHPLTPLEDVAPYVSDSPVGDA